jgi:hypothetical protein
VTCRANAIEAEETKSRVATTTATRTTRRRLDRGGRGSVGASWTRVWVPTEVIDVGKARGRCAFVSSYCGISSTFLEG